MVSFILFLVQNRRAHYWILAIFLLVALLFSALYAFLPETGPNPSLIFNLKENPNKPVSGFITYFYFSITTQTKVGFGDIVPASDPAKIITIIQVLFGYFYIILTVVVYVAKMLVRSTRFASLVRAIINKQ